MNTSDITYGSLEDIVESLDNISMLTTENTASLLSRLTKEIIELKKRPSGTQLSIRQQMNSLSY